MRSRLRCWDNQQRGGSAAAGLEISFALHVFAARRIAFARFSGLATYIQFGSRNTMYVVESWCWGDH